MSKNLTRKGLALGAIVSLGASVFAGTPAFAADELTLAPFTGTAYKTIEGETFKLLTGLAPATPAGNVVQLKYQVQNQLQNQLQVQLKERKAVVLRQYQETI
jgi:hypothetical protein